MELDGTAPSSCLFASKRSYSIGFKDFPCLRVDKINIANFHHSVPKVYRELIRNERIVHLSVPKQVLLGFSGCNSVRSGSVIYFAN